MIQEQGGWCAGVGDLEEEEEEEDRELESRAAYTFL